MVDRLGVQADLEVQVRTRDVAGVAGPPDRLAALDPLPVTDVGRRLVRVGRDDGAPLLRTVLEDGEVAVAAAVGREEHHPVLAAMIGMPAPAPMWMPLCIRRSP